MIAPILPVGAFIWCRFPLHEAHRAPGPIDHLHLCYIADTVGKDALTLYTTSVLWDPSIPEPEGIIVVSVEQAAQMKQKPFVLDARRIGIFPITTEWFPDLEDKDHGIVYIANDAFQKKVARVAKDVAVKHRQNIEFYGPTAPTLPDKSGWTPPKHK